MPPLDVDSALITEMTAWRRHIHAHPELAFREHETATFVAERLAEFGMEVERGIGGTGVVATLARGEGPSIGLRADMDALPIREESGVGHASTNPGVMHACGHDGHTAMLLGSARILAQRGNFKGTVRFIFQPAEEMEGGALAMVKDGLFERFPVDSVYGLHNWPQMPAGIFGVKAGPIMACCDTFELTVEGRGGHGAMPHLADDPIVVSSEIVTALQTLASRRTDPQDSLVVSITAMMAGDNFNAIPHRAVMRGTARAFREEVRNTVKPAIRRLAEGIAGAHGLTAGLDFHRRYPPTVNHEAEAAFAANVAERVAGPERIERHPTPSMGAEDFAYMLEKRPGCYIWLGSGRDGDNPPLHNAHFDFNDGILPIGARFWTALVEEALAP